MRHDFSQWAKWIDRNGLERIQFPGVYAIARSHKDISGTAFSWRRDVIYVGMTNAKGGLKSRLQQFDITIRRGGPHGGAQRVRYKYRNYMKLVPLLYVSVCPRQCDVLSNKSADLRVMGEVAKQEYYCLAQFAKTFGGLPEFNDKKRSRKK